MIGPRLDIRFRHTPDGVSARSRPFCLADPLASRRRWRRPEAQPGGGHRHTALEDVKGVEGAVPAIVRHQHRAAVPPVAAPRPRSSGCPPARSPRRLGPGAGRAPPRPGSDCARQRAGGVRVAEDGPAAAEEPAELDQRVGIGRGAAEGVRLAMRMSQASIIARSLRKIAHQAASLGMARRLATSSFRGGRPMMPYLAQIATFRRACASASGRNTSGPARYAVIWVAMSLKELLTPPPSRGACRWCPRPLWSSNEDRAPRRPCWLARALPRSTRCVRRGRLGIH